MVAVKVTKVQVASNQLDAAIELFFLSDNSIAVHTLTAAAYNVLRDLARRDGLDFPFIKTGFVSTLKKSDKSKVIAFLNGPENFFKHADRDPDGVLEFDPELTELMLIDACSYFKERPDLKPKHFDAIKVWSGSLRADVPKGSPEGLATLAIVQRLKVAGKKQFWEWYCGLTAAKQKYPNAF
ncbi:hypothetical protein CS053_15875 [Rhodanobacter glycinis]|uniref:Uncharacterized protein n=1 Tax=Rhodanobacter glycinis TaxID=582702 RepID=A0A5B9E0B4_9GAMM|nr:hypothetical protein [Rhodanobacter glycinis]QEE25822.1 hypothetical protein CS053_15875 [Rhodanobacter glycinis]